MLSRAFGGSKTGMHPPAIVMDGYIFGVQVLNSLAPGFWRKDQYQVFAGAKCWQSS